jgi:Tol biopolymer transport system component
MSDRFRENKTIGRVAVKIITEFISLGLVAIFCLSCGGGGDIDDGGSGSKTNSFPPVVFMADNNNDGSVELYASFDNGTNIVQLSETMVPGGNAVDFRVSPNGLWVAYVADQDTNNKFELYVVPVDKTAGDDAVKISGDPMAGDGVKDTATGRFAFQWAPDTSRIAYLADQTTRGVIELYSNTPDGNSRTTIRLSILPQTDRDVEDFAWSPNLVNQPLIAYLADQDTLDAIELYTTSPTASISQKINTGLGAGRNVTVFKWSPDARRIAFIADKTAGIFQLYTTFPTTTNDTLVSGSLAVTSDVLNFKWSPDSARLAYLVRSVIPDFQLLTTPNASLASILISSDIENSADSNYGWSWDGSLIAFIADENTADKFELFTSDPVDVSTKTRVSDGLVSGGDVIAFKWAPFELLIAYTADQDIDDKIELYTTNPPPGGAVIKVSGGIPFAGNGVEDDFKWAPDSSLIAYRADQDTPNKIELYSTDPGGLENDKVSGTLPSGGDVDEFKWNDDFPDPSIGYLANQISVTVTELFASLADGSENARLSSDLVDGLGDPVADSDVLSFEWVP